MPGPGVLAKPTAVTDAWELHPVVDGPRAAMRAEYGFDVLAHGLLTEHYSPHLNLVTTIEPLFVPARSERQCERFAGFPFRCIGVFADDTVKRITHSRAGPDCVAASLPAERINAARRIGSRVLYVSMGTVANSRFWHRQFGPLGGTNELTHCTGKQLVQHIFRTCFEALGGDEGILVIMAVGPQDDALDGLPPTPPNFELQPTLPQVEVLTKCDAFITHGGANSMHEALAYGVPLVVVPIFGDQPANAETVERCGTGVSFLTRCAR